jgi:hypothetical protein
VNEFNDMCGAVLSPCRKYRYRLWRVWGDASKRCVFVGLNPSTADETKDDATIRKCIGFAKRWKFGAIDMVNLFAWRATKPEGLLETPCPAAPDDHYPNWNDNDRHTQAAFQSASRIVFAWGGGYTGKLGTLIRNHEGSLEHVFKDAFLSDPLRRMHGGTMPLPAAGILGRTKDGSPRHPLMLAYTTPFEEVPFR